MKWKCKLSGNVIDLPDWEDANMVGHDGYEKVEVEQHKQEEENKKPVARKTKE